MPSWTPNIVVSYSGDDAVWVCRVTSRAIALGIPAGQESVQRSEPSDLTHDGPLSVDESQAKPV